MLLSIGTFTLGNHPLINLDNTKELKISDSILHLFHIKKKSH